jgi:hypothetical protein
MLNILRRLKPAQDEVRHAAHDQDLIEVSKRARLDREAEYNSGLQKPELVVPASMKNL